MTIRVLALFLLLAALLPAQHLRVYSEFRRIDPYGDIVPMDQGGRPREILSPLMARNSHSTFFVVASAPPGQIYYFYVNPNPPEFLDIKVYKAMYRQTDHGWVPDGLRPIESPYTAHIPDSFHGISDQKVEMFVVDAWVKSDAKPGRMKLDFQLYADDRWVTYPMEARITDAVAPDLQPVSRRLFGVEARSDAGILGPVREYVCGIPDPSESGNGQTNIRSLILRNVMEDLALARSIEPNRSREVLGAELLTGLGGEWESFCDSEGQPELENPEWLLRGRDLLYQGPGIWY